MAPWGALFLATLIAYWPALRGELVWDDSAHVTRPELQSLRGLWRIWFELGATQQYYPVLHSAFWMEHRLWGDAVLGYHLVNVLLHSLAAYLVVLLVRRLSLPGAWFAGFVFALHPVYVEAVAWISEQKSTLSGVFCLSALLVYLRFDESRRKQSYFLALGLFLLAILSKSVTATLPAVLLVIFWWQRGRLDWRRDALPLAPWFALAVPMGLLTAWVERTFIGASGRDFNLTFTERLLLAGRVPWFYAAKLVWPADLTFTYPRWKIDPAALWQYLYPAGTVMLAVILLLAARRNRGPLASFLIFVGTLVPVLGFLNVLPFRFSWVADHFQYLPSLGLVIPLAAYLTTTSRRLFPPAGWLHIALAAAAVIVLGVLSFRQGAIYRNEQTLYEQTLARNPSSWLAHNNLGILLASKPGRLTEAIAHFQAAAAQEQPQDPTLHTNLGGALALAGHPEEAVKEYREALALKPDAPDTWLNLGTALEAVGETEPAAAAYGKALQIRPNYPEALNSLALLRRKAKDYTAAIDLLQRAIAARPDFAAAHFNLGVTYSDTNHYAEAAVAFRNALNAGGDASYLHLIHYGLGVCYLHLNSPSEAAAEFSKSLESKPDFDRARRSLEAIQKTGKP
jgi:tetratricopeptide (TPR) repeat protein